MRNAIRVRHIPGTRCAHPRHFFAQGVRYQIALHVAKSLTGVLSSRCFCATVINMPFNRL